MLNEKSVFDMVSGIAKTHAESYTKLVPLGSIYVYNHRRSYKVGNMVLVEDGKLINSQGEVPTHEVIKLEGTLQNTRHAFTVRSLSTDEILKIEL